MRGDFLKKFLSLALCVITLLSVFTLSVSASDSEAVTAAGQVNISSGKLNVRSGSSSASTVKGSLNRNAYVTILKKSGSFYYIRYAEKSYGYAHSNYIKTVSENIKYVKTSSGSLRVRSNASLSSSVKGYLKSGTPVVILSTSSSFSRILYNGNSVGYVHSDYLTKYKAIRLSVPSFKQNDSRWADIEIGNSGQTMSAIGCVTTALAMTESHKTGTTVYPHQMEKKLSYTSGGAVYWPTSYNIITSGSGYLSKIHELLQSGKPVILGAKKSNGSQHYVVITGVKAGNALTTSSFYINDPGSSTRTTLNQFLAVYPTFYKMIVAK